MEIFNKSISRIIHFAFVLGCLSMIISVLITSANIIIRLFGYALNGSVEIVVNLNVLIAFLSLGLCAMEDGHIKVDIFKKWPFLDHLCAIATIAGIALFGYCAVYQGRIVYRLSTKTSVLDLVKWPFYIATALGYFTAAIALIGKEVNSLVNWIISKKKPMIAE